MPDCLDLGSVPSYEDCAQVGSEGYGQRARRECQAYINQLRRLYGEEPDGARLSMKSNPHDFGTYYSVVCYFDGDNKQAADYAYRCEAGTDTWDAEALSELSGPTSTRKERP